ncbi:hypothetical protein DPEC_G00180990 [Dallia pectoralis]|uniref:Uncharacterized protein n=1 Tax=Dallia pectoralis TaxID=75939 RepID=A0ACC2GAF0_DALPE|nr:hypothetical protein DPEC_G00180990 [Dallia pectoralis]
MGNVSMLVVCVAVIFSLVSVSQTAPVSHTCEELLKPLEMKTTDPLLGTFSLVGISNNRPGSKLLCEVFLINMRWDVVSLGTSDTLKSTISLKFPDSNTLPGQGKKLITFPVALSENCHPSVSNMTLEDNKLSWIFGVPSTAVFLPTCPDCLLTQTTSSINGNTYTSLELYSKRRELTTDELLQFKTQIDCLKMPTAYFTKTTSELCSDYEGQSPLNFAKEILDFMEHDVVNVFLRMSDFLIETGERLGVIRPGEVRIVVLNLVALITYIIFHK